MRHSYTHIMFSGASNDVQAVGMIGYDQIIGQTPPADPRSQLAGYVVDTLTGPTNARAGASVHLPGNIPRYSAPLLARPKAGAQPGYVADHAVYRGVRNEHIREAYSTNLGEEVVVEVRLVVKLPGKVKAELVYVCVNESAVTI
jgi:hypothetical protein